MQHTLYGNLIFDSILFGGISIFFLALGIRGLIKKKPYLISSKWIFIMVMICFLPQVLNTFFLSKNINGAYILGQIGFFALMFYFMYRLLIMRQAYMAYGVTDVTLREALHYVLKKMSLDFEETLGSIKLPAQLAEIQVSIQSWMGVGQVRIKDKKDFALLEEIVKGLNKYYQESETSVNMSIFIIYFVMGILMATIPFFFIYLVKYLPTHISSSIN